MFLRSRILAVNTVVLKERMLFVAYEFKKALDKPGFSLDEIKLCVALFDVNVLSVVRVKVAIKPDMSPLKILVNKLESLLKVVAIKQKTANKKEILSELEMLIATMEKSLSFYVGLADKPKAYTQHWMALSAKASRILNEYKPGTWISTSSYKENLEIMTRMVESINDVILGKMTPESLEEAIEQRIANYIEKNKISREQLSDSSQIYPHFLASVSEGLATFKQDLIADLTKANECVSLDLRESKNLEFKIKSV